MARPNMAEWTEEYEARVGAPMHWWIAPGGRDAYVSRFEGTFTMALQIAAKAAAWSKSTVLVREDLTDRGVAPMDRMGAVWAKISAPGDSPLRLES